MSVPIGVEERYLIRTSEGTHSKPVHSIAASHALDRDYLVTGSVDRKVRFLDSQSGDEVAVCLGHQRSVMAVSISQMGPNGEDPLICSGGREGSIIVWDPDEQFSGRMVKIPIEEIRCIAVYQGSETYILVGNKEGVLVLWDLTNDVAVVRFEGAKGCIHCCSICSLITDPETQNDLEHLCIASGGADRCVRLWDIKDPTNRKRKLRHNRSVGCMAIAGKGFRPVLASGASDNLITIWDITSCLQLQVLEGHLGPVNQICFWEGYEILVISASADRTVRVFDALTSECVCTLVGHQDDVLDLVVTSEVNPAIASCSLDNTIKFWDLDQIIKDFYKSTGEDIGSRNTRPPWTPHVEYHAPKTKAEMMAAQEERTRLMKEQRAKRKKAKKKKLEAVSEAADETGEQAETANKPSKGDSDEDSDDDFFAAPTGRLNAQPAPALGTPNTQRQSQVGFLVLDEDPPEPEKEAEVSAAETTDSASVGFGNKVHPLGVEPTTSMNVGVAAGIVSAVRRMSTKITFKRRFSSSVHPDDGSAQNEAGAGAVPTGKSARGGATRQSVMYRKADELQLQFVKAEKSKVEEIDRQKSAAAAKLAERLNKRKGIESSDAAASSGKKEGDGEDGDDALEALRQEKLLQHKLQEARMRKAMEQSQMRSAQALQKRLEEIALKRAAAQVISDDEDSDEDPKPTPHHHHVPASAAATAATDGEGDSAASELAAASVEAVTPARDIFYLSDDEDEDD